MVPVLIYGQGNSIREIKEYYKNQSDTNCIKAYIDSTAHFKQIFLIRHGNPDLNKKGWRNRNEAILYMRNYDSVGVKLFDKKPLCPIGLKTDTIFHSSIPRAKSTAQLIFENDYVLCGSYRYREYERKCLKFFNIKLPLKFWTISSRLLWMMGLNKRDIESIKQANGRATGNATMLDQNSNLNEHTILVAHGLHNKYVKKFLKKRGWKKVYSDGKSYLSMMVLVKVKE